MRCYCFHDTLTPDLIERYVLEGATLWAVYRRCPLHDYQAVSPVWSPDIDLSDKEETAADEAAALMR